MSEHTRPAPLAHSFNEQELSARRRKQLRARRVARWGKRLLLAAVAAGMLAAGFYAFIPKPVTVDVATSRRGRVQQIVEDDGRTRVRERFVVSAPLGGELERVTLKSGDPVAAGDLVGRIRPPLLLDARSRAEAEARLAAAEARERQSATAAARVRAASQLADREAARARELGTVIADVERDRAETQARAAREELAGAVMQHRAAAAEARAVRATLDGVTGSGEPVPVVAPTAGKVLRVLRESAGPIAAGTPLVEIGDPRDLEVVVDVLSSDVARIAVGARAWLEQWGGDRPLRARVRAVEPSAFTHISALGVEEQRVNVILTLEEQAPALGDGYRVEARILVAEIDGALVVPASGVFRHGDGWGVYAVVDGRAALRAVELGLRGRADVEIRSGLAEGVPIVLYAGERTRDGVAVRPRAALGD